MKTKIMAMLATLMITLSVVGYVYAHWSDTIYINGVIDMGSFCFGFTTCGPSGDNEPMKTPPKEVGDINCWLDQPEVCAHTNKTVYNKLWVNITNGYPEYIAWCNFTLDNGGTIPLDVYMWCVLIDTGDGLTYTWNTTADPAYIFGYYDLSGDGYYNATEPVVLNIYFDWYFGQIDPCQSINNRITVHIKQPALMCHDYAFEVFIHAWQWDPAPHQFGEV